MAQLATGCQCCSAVRSRNSIPQCLLSFRDGNTSGKGNYLSEERKFVIVAQEREKHSHHSRDWDGLGIELRMVLLCLDVLINTGRFLIAVFNLFHVAAINQTLRVL